MAIVAAAAAAVAAAIALASSVSSTQIVWCVTLRALLCVHIFEIIGLNVQMNESANSKSGERIETANRPMVYCIVYSMDSLERHILTQRFSFL